MKPIGPLMREHRLIERMVSLLESELRRLSQENKLKPGFIQETVDFFETYADGTHHGKEENILFRSLAQKRISREHREAISGLIADHELSRQTVSKLAEAVAKYEAGSTGSLAGIKESLKVLVELYPRHIEKEDRHFFYPVMEHFTKEEQDSMLQEFWEFDRSLIHEKYQEVVAGLEKR